MVRRLLVPIPVMEDGGMKILFPILAGLVILTMTKTTALADIPSPWGRPQRPFNPQPVRPLEPSSPVASKPAALLIDATTQNGVRLVLPAQLVKELQAAAAHADTPGPTSRLPCSSIMVGLSLSMALACVGLGMVRSQRRMTFAALFCLAGMTMFAGLGCPNQNIIPNNPVTLNVIKERDEKSTAVLEGTGSVEIRGDIDKVQITVDKVEMKSFIERTDLPTVP
jgi:hypothetical protein